MVAKLCSRSHGQPLPGVRSAAMMSMSRAMSRDGVMGHTCRDGGMGDTPGAPDARRAGHKLRCLAAPCPAAPTRETPMAGIEPGHPQQRRLGASVAAALGLAARPEQEPAALLGLVDEILQEARGRHVLVL